MLLHSVGYINKDISNISMCRGFLLHYGPYAYQWKKQFANVQIMGLVDILSKLNMYISSSYSFWLIYKRISRWHEEGQDNFLLKKQSFFFMKGGDRYLFFKGLCDPTTSTKCTIHWQPVSCGWMCYQGLLAYLVHPPTCTSPYIDGWWISMVIMVSRWGIR
jgi:hypothetical protein